MKNNIFNLDYYTWNNNEVKNPFNFNTKKAKEILEKYPYMFYTKIIVDNVRPEVLAYKEYNDSSLWDIIVMLNYTNTLWIFPKDQDWIDEQSEARVDLWEKTFSVTLSTEKRAQKKEEFRLEFEEENEKRRTVILLKKEYLTLFKEKFKE